MPSPVTLKSHAKAVEDFGKSRKPQGDELTIALGVIIVVKAFHPVDTQDDDASDELDTINGGSTGDTLVLRAAHDDRSIVVKHGTGNIYMDSAADKTLDNSLDTLSLVYDAGLAKWIQTSFSSNGA